MSNECVKPEIPQFPELTFEEERHLYYLNGLEVPSVTTLMKPLSSDFYSTVDPEVLNKAAKRGTAIHNAVENYAKFGIEDIPPVYAGYFAGSGKTRFYVKPNLMQCFPTSDYPTSFVVTDPKGYNYRGQSKDAFTKSEKYRIFVTYRVPTKNKRR